MEQTVGMELDAIADFWIGVGLICLAVVVAAWSMYRWAPRRYIPRFGEPPLPTWTLLLWGFLLVLGLNVLSNAVSWWLSALVTVGIGGIGLEGFRLLHNRGLSRPAALPTRPRLDPPPPPEGWYPDPADPSRERWWDGRTWHQESRPQTDAFAIPPIALPLPRDRRER